MSDRLLDAVKEGDAATVRRLLHLPAEKDTPRARPTAAAATRTAHDADAAATAAASDHADAADFPHPRASPSSCDSDGSSALHWAGWVAAADAFRSLLDAGADVGAINVRKESVLEWALRGGDMAILRMLLTRPPSPSSARMLAARNAFGGTAMHIAAEEGLLEAMAALRIMGADLDARDQRGKTPLMCAAHRAKPAAVTWLLRHGATPSLRDSERATALHYAAIGGNEMACGALIHSGALASALHVGALAGDDTPEELAKKHGHAQCAKMLAKTKRVTSAVFNRFVLRDGLDLPATRRSFLSFPQLYFFSTLFLTLLHFGLLVHPTLSDPLRSNLQEDPVFQSMLWVTWVGALAAAAGMGLFRFVQPGMAEKGKQRALAEEEEMQDMSASTAATTLKPGSSRWLVSQALSGGSVCVPCRLVRPIRSKHCTLCGGCVLRMDHHCPWVNTCVGVGNHRSFMVLVFTMLAATFCHTFLCFTFLFSFVIHGLEPGAQWAALGAHWFSILVLFHSVLVALGCTALLIGQSYTVAQALTTNEAVNRWRYPYIANAGGRSPFSQGVWGNCMAFWGLKHGRSFIRPGRESGKFTLGAIDQSAALTLTPAVAKGDAVLLDMGSLQQQAANGHGHSHGGQACHGHGNGAGHADVPTAASNGHSHSHTASHPMSPPHGGSNSQPHPPSRTSPPPPSGSLHLHALCHPPRGPASGMAAVEEAEPDCAYISAPLSSPPEGRAAAGRGEMLLHDDEQRLYAPHTSHRTQVEAQQEAVGLISGKDKHR